MDKFYDLKTMTQEKLNKLALERNTLEEENKYLNNKLANYVLLLDKKIKTYDYDYIEILFRKKTRKDILKAYTYKCEQLEKLHEVYNKQEIEMMKTKNKIDELTKCIDDNVVFKHDGDDYGYTEYVDLKISLQEFIETEKDILKGSDK